MSQSAFIVTKFTNRNGVTSWRVDGRLNGLRIRKNFKSREEAGAEKAALDAKAAQTETGVRTTLTRLTEEQLHEAEAAFRRLAASPKSLSFYLDFALANYRAPDREQTLADAVTAYVAFKTREHEQNLLSISQHDHIRRHLDVLMEKFPAVLVSQLTTQQLTEHCQRENARPKTINNRRGILHTFFKFAFQKDWVAVNPVDKMPHHRIAHRRGSAKTLSADQAEKLMHHVETINGGEMVPYFALALFAGIRPCLRHGEILKLTPEQPPAPAKPRSAPEPTVFDRYAASLGFQFSGNGYTHADGRLIVKSSTPFHWQLLDSRGACLRRYWASRDCLEKGVEVAAELWTLTHQAPGEITWVVVSDDRGVVALTGHELTAQTDAAVLKLYPATYRLLTTESEA